ncbi:hypothetical protein OG991_41630 [Streptomyces mirabilis]|nr:hypothetical protein [Streptomyces mirabilis]MCX4425987.1 hypothetical protein [Streptomyces mirabilis]
MTQATLQAEIGVQIAGGGREDRRVVAGLWESATAGGGAVGVADGEGERAAHLTFGAQPQAELVGQAEQRPPMLAGIEFVAGEGVAGAGGADQRGAGHGSGVIATGSGVELAAGGGADDAGEHGGGGAGQFTDRGDPVPGKGLGDGLLAAKVALKHISVATTEGYANPRELHQTGEKTQVASSRRGPDRLRGYYDLTS